MQRKAMFAKKKDLAFLYEEDPKEMKISDRLSSVFNEDVLVANPTITYFRPEIKVMTGSKAGGSVAHHIHVMRDLPKEYLVDERGIARFSYDVC
jgi:hypothetical protein